MRSIFLSRMRHWLRRHPALHREIRWATLSIVDRAPGGRRFLNALADQRATVPYASYQRWIRQNDQPTPPLQDSIRQGITLMPRHPLISVVMPAYNTPELYLREAIGCLQAQLYPHWELCVADDASPAPHVERVLRAAAERDPRIRYTRRERNGHISMASNSALALATGEFVALMDHDDLLPPHALAVVAHAILRHPEAEVLFSDEDKIDAQGRRSDPYFKPGWNPELLLTQNVVSHLGVYRRQLLEKIGGFRVGLEGSQDWDLALRATAGLRPEQVRHIPMVLYHWRQGTGAASFSEAALERCALAGRQAVQEYLASQGEADAQVLPQSDLPGWSSVAFPVPERRSVSIILTHADGEAEAEPWPHVPPCGGIEVLTVPASKRLEAAGAAQHDILVFLAQHLRPDHPEWLDALLALAARANVGAAGPLVLSKAGRVAQAGLVSDAATGAARGIPYLTGMPFPAVGYHGHLRLPRQVSALGGECLAVRRATFAAIAAREPGLAGADWNLHLCRHLIRDRQRVVWTPAARFVGTRDAPAPSSSGPELDGDPFFNPNLSSTGHDLRLRAGQNLLASLAKRMNTVPYG